MTKLREAEAEAAGPRWDGTQNQEQEPHTKMWEKTWRFPRLLIALGHFENSDSSDWLRFWFGESRSLSPFSSGPKRPSCDQWLIRGAKKWYLSLTPLCWGAGYPLDFCTHVQCLGDRGLCGPLRCSVLTPFRRARFLNGGPTPRKIDANIKEVPSWHIEVEFFG